MNPANRLTGTVSAQSGRTSAKSVKQQAQKTLPVVETISIAQFMKPKKQPETEPDVKPAPAVVPITSYSAAVPDTTVLSSALKDEILLNESLKARLRAWEQQPAAGTGRDTRQERVEALLAENRSLRNWGEGLQADIQLFRQQYADLQQDAARLLSEADALREQLSDEKDQKHNLQKDLMQAESRLQELTGQLQARPAVAHPVVPDEKPDNDTELASFSQGQTTGLMKTLGYVYQVLQSCLAKLGGSHLVSIPTKPLNLQVLLLEIRSLSISLNSEVELAEGKRAALEKKYLTTCSKLHDAEELALRLNKAVEESQTDLRAEIERAELLEAKLAEFEEEWKQLNQKPSSNSLRPDGKTYEQHGSGTDSQPYIEHLEQALALQEHLNGLHKQVLARIVDSLHPTIGTAVDLFLRANTDLIVLGDEHPFGVEEQPVSSRIQNESLEEWKSRFEAEKSKRIHQSLQKGSLFAVAEEANAELEQALERIRSMQKIELTDFTDLQQDGLGDPSSAVNPYLSDSLKYLRPGSSYENRRNNEHDHQADFNRRTPTSGHGSGRPKTLVDSGTDFSDIKTKLRIIKASELLAED